MSWARAARVARLPMGLPIKREATIMATHWHAAYGVTGYGPDGADGFMTATDAPTLADTVRTELESSAESAHGTAHGYGDAGMYESAWREIKVSESLSTLAANFSNDRANAPLYAGKPELWAETVIRMAGENFPLALDHGDTRRLYVWDCADDACEHLADLGN